MSLLIQQAKSLAIQLHAEQTDKAGKPYAHHLKAVTDALIGNSMKLSLQDGCTIA